MENLGGELKKGSKVGVWKSLWWPRVTGIVIAILTLSLMNYGQTEQLGLWIGSVLILAAALLWRGMYSVTVVRWWAKIAGVFTISMLMLLIVGESVVGVGPPMSSIGDVLSLVPWLLVLIGMVIALVHWEFIGGIVVVLGAVADQLIILFGSDIRLSTYDVLFALVGLGLIYCSWRTSRLSIEKST
jgi:hypothetical protein